MTASTTDASALVRGPGRGRLAAPIRLVHLGLGNFFRAHQAWYTEHAADADRWGIAAFTGRSSELSDALSAQEGLYTLVTRGAAGDRFELIGSISAAHAAADHHAWLGYFESPEVQMLTITVTEAGYLRGDDGGLNRGEPALQADIEALRGDLTATVVTAPARILAGLAARRAADAGPIAIVPCDNLPENAAAVAGVVRDLADIVDPTLVAWLDDSVSQVTTMVDRITPRTTADIAESVAAATGRNDLAPLATEPFTEWVLSGTFPGGRPRWEDAGATFTDDVTPYEQRKLWLLNGAHSLLAYAGSSRGHTTVADAVTDPTCRDWLIEWWADASSHVSLPAGQVTAYRAALLDRFANRRIHHRLDQIGADGSQKIAVRILPVLRLERAAGRVPEGATRILAAWICHLRGAGIPVNDAHADQLEPLTHGALCTAVSRILAFLDPAVADDAAVTAAVLADAEHLSRS